MLTAFSASLRCKSLHCGIWMDDGLGQIFLVVQFLGEKAGRRTYLMSLRVATKGQNKWKRFALNKNPADYGVLLSYYT